MYVSDHREQPLYSSIDDFPAAAVQSGLEKQTDVSYDIPGTKGRVVDHAINLMRSLPNRYPFAQIPPPSADMLDLCRKQRAAAVCDEDIDGPEEIIGEFLDPTPDELLRCWKTLASVSTAGSLDWRDERVVATLAEIGRRAAEFTDEQLAECVRYLSFLKRYKYPRPPALHVIKNALDLVCAERLREEFQLLWEGKSESLLDETARQSCFSLALLWIKVGLVTNTTFFDWNSKYLENLWPCLGEDFIDKLSPPELVFLMFLVGLYREFPGHNTDKKLAQGVAFPDYLSRKLLTDIPQLGFEELGILIHARTTFKARIV